MNRYSTIAWVGAAWAVVGLCGCSTTNPFKKKGLPAATGPELGYKPGQTVPTPGTGSSVAGANTAATGSVAATSPASTPAPQTYPSTGLNSTPIGAVNNVAATQTARPTWGEQKPAADGAKSWAPPAVTAGSPTAVGWTPGSSTGAAPSAGSPANMASTAPPGGSTSAQEGYYNPAYTGDPGKATAPGASGFAGVSSPERTAAAGNPFAAPTILAGGNDSRFPGAPAEEVRTADSRWGRPPEAAPRTESTPPWVTKPVDNSNVAPSGAVAPSGSGGPWGNAPSSSATGDPLPGSGIWASKNGATTPADDARSAPRRDPHYRPGNTRDFQQNAPLTPSGAMLQPRASGTNNVLPAGFISQVPEAPRRAEKVATEVEPGLLSGDPSVPTTSGDLDGSGSRYSLNNASELDGVPVSSGGPNANNFFR